ncbi:MAG: hypothetical protein II751_02030 [Bacteroidales bacterium]|jgi:hypothetical protein|nr:hypothetical protein [Bacteroidales bacterium]MCR5549320.1 hypothetical protein [Bacteroidales bacterium]
MKHFAILLLTGLLLASAPAAQAQRNKIQQQSKFIFMSSLSYAGGVGDIRLASYDCHDLILPPKLEDEDLLKTVRNKNFNIQVHQLFAYQFNNFFYMGIGTGIDFWNRTAFVPLYLNFSVNMMQTKVAPMAFINLGWGFKWYISSRPDIVNRVIHGSNWGPMGEGGLGIRIQLTDKVGLMLAGTYKVQYSKIRYTIPVENETDYSADFANSIQPAIYHFAGFKVGVIY